MERVPGTQLTSCSTGGQYSHEYSCGGVPLVAASTMSMDEDSSYSHGHSEDGCYEGEQYDKSDVTGHGDPHADYGDYQCPEFHHTSNNQPWRHPTGPGRCHPDSSAYSYGYCCAYEPLPCHGYGLIVEARMTGQRDYHDAPA